MTDIASYAVFLHEGALTALGEAIKPFLQESPQGAHLVCKEIDSGGAFFEMVLDSRNAEGEMVEVELMIPASMVRLVISMHSEGEFGFRHPLRAKKLGGVRVAVTTVPEAVAVNTATPVGDKPDGS